MSRDRSPMMSDGRCMNPGPGNVWWAPEPAYTTIEFGPPLPTIGAVVDHLRKRADAIDDGQHAAEADALDYAAAHVEALADQYEERFGPAVEALERLTEFAVAVTVDHGPNGRAIISLVEELLWGLGFQDYQYGAVAVNAFPEDATGHPPSIDRRGVRANYGPRLADRLTEFMDTLDPSDAETLTIALHRDITDREES